MVKETVDAKVLAATLAKELLAANRFATLADTEEILVYRDGVYRPGGEAFIKGKVQKNVDATEVSNHLVLETLGQIQRSTLVDRAAFESGNPHLVLENCAFNLETMSPEPFSPDRYELNKLPVKFEPSADCPTFKNFLSEILSPADIAGVQEEVGAILRKKYLTKKLSIYLGDTDTGKTTLMAVYLALLGPENVSSVSIQDLASKNRFAIAELYGKLANIRDDLPKDVIYSVGKLKELTGGFQVQGERKFRDPFDFTNHAYMIFTCNVLPPVEEDDNAFYNRVMIRKFPKRFGGHDRPDRELLDRLTTPQELSGILNWALEGLKRLKGAGWSFTTVSSTEETRLEYKRRSDPIWAFAQDCLDDSNSESFEPKEGLYNAFKSFCEVQGFQNPGKDFFYKHLGDKITVQSAQRGPKGASKHCFLGVRLRAQQILEGEDRAYHDYPADQEGIGKQGKQGKHGSAHSSSVGELGKEGICEYCGKPGILTKTAEGRYVCSNCLKEDQP
jgi:putative DNA primase/helicase